MRGEPTDSWGKLDQNEEGRVLEWNPVAAHCAPGQFQFPPWKPVSGTLTCWTTAPSSRRTQVSHYSNRSGRSERP